MISLRPTYIRREQHSTADGLRAYGTLLARITLPALLLLTLLTPISSFGQILPDVDRAESEQGTDQLGRYVTTDGKIRPDVNGYHTFDASGWEMRLDGDGAPRFFAVGDEAKGAVPAAQVPDDVYWSDAFNTTGVVGTINVVVVSGCNDIYIGGDFSEVGDVPARNVARWDGIKWNAIGTGLQSGVSGPVYAIAETEGRLYVGGRFDSAGPLVVNNIAYFNGVEWKRLGFGVDGWDEWGLPAPGIVYTIAIRNSDVYVGGDFDSVANVAPGPSSPQIFARNIARWDGATWSAMGDGLLGSQQGQPTDNGAVYDIDFGIDGIYAGGRFLTSGSTSVVGLARWDGATWQPVGGNLSGNGPVVVFAIDARGGDIYIGGVFNRVGSTTVSNIAVWSATLNRWFTFGSGSTTPVRALDVDGHKIYASGSFTGLNETTPKNVAVWEGDGWRPLGRGSANGTDTVVLSIAAGDGEVYLAGPFKIAGATSSTGIALWNVGRQTWTSLNNNTSGSGGVNGQVYAVAVTDEYLYVGGRFSTVGSVTTNSLARWHRKTGVWSPLGGGVQIDPNISVTRLPSVRAIDVDGDNVYVGGRFDIAGGVVAYNIARWDGVRWTSLGDGIGPNASGTAYDSVSTVYAIGAYNGKVYVGGSFTLAGGQLANRIALWEEGTQKWSPLGGGIGGSSFDTHVNAIAIDRNDPLTKVYIGGVFAVTGSSQRASNIAQFDGTEWSDLDIGLKGEVYALAVDLSGNLYAGGNFTTTSSGLASPYIAHWNGTRWSKVGKEFNTPVHALATGPRGLYAAGTFSFTGATMTNRVALWDGSTWLALGSGLDGNEYGSVIADALAVDEDEVFVGGRFTTAGEKSSLNIAQWHKPGPKTEEGENGGSSSPAPLSTVTDRTPQQAEFTGTIWPNPASRSTTLSFHSPFSGTYTLRLTAVDGRESILKTGVAVAGSRQEEILDLSDYPSGVYRLTVRGTGCEWSKELILRQ